MAQNIRVTVHFRRWELSCVYWPPTHPTQDQPGDDDDIQVEQAPGQPDWSELDPDRHPLVWEAILSAIYEALSPG